MTLALAQSSSIEEREAAKKEKMIERERERGLEKLRVDLGVRGPKGHRGDKDKVEMKKTEAERGGGME